MDRKFRSHGSRIAVSSCSGLTHGHHCCIPNTQRWVRFAISSCSVFHVRTIIAVLPNSRPPLATILVCCSPVQSIPPSHHHRRRPTTGRHIIALIPYPPSATAPIFISLNCEGTSPDTHAVSPVTLRHPSGSCGYAFTSRHCIHASVQMPFPPVGYLSLLSRAFIIPC
jgi:hypothetical protein